MLNNPLRSVSKTLQQYLIVIAILLICYEIFDFYTVDGLDVLFYEVYPTNTELFPEGTIPYDKVSGLTTYYLKRGAGIWRLFLFPLMVI